jgi:hypothetical protein
MAEQVDVRSTTKEQVAYDLMALIAREEGTYPKGDKAREYYLELYYRCFNVTIGHAPK